MIREFPPIGKYRARIVRSPRGTSFDLREWVDTESFSGFTRRGVRLVNGAQLDLLRDILKEAIETLQTPAPQPTKP